MKISTIRWHLARDNQIKLYTFCDKNKTRSSTELINDEVFNMTFTFNNGGYITAELLRGKDGVGHTINEHFQVVDYGFGI